MYDYPLLAALAAVVRHGSFEGAARALHVTPSAISQRIKLLEERVGKVLVVRGQPCTATRAGAALCRHVEQVVLLEGELRQRLPELGAAGEGAVAPTVCIAANADSVATWFIRPLARFAATHPVLFDLVVDDQEHTAALLRSGAAHGAVTTLAEPVQGCRAVRLGKLRYFATCTPTFRQRYFARGVTRASLAAAPCLVFNAKDRLQHQFVRRVVRSEVALPVHWLPSPNGFVDACLADLGWGMNPEALVRDQLASGALVELTPGRPVDIELYWQSWRLAAGWFAALSEIIADEARQQLRS